MSIKITTTSQAASLHGIKTLVYGDSGRGKTVLTATLPSPVLISAESGLLSLRRENLERIYGKNNPTITYDIPVIEVKTVEDLRDAYAWCSQSKEATNFHSVALDSISEIGEVVLNNARQQVKDPRQAYGELIEKMETLIRSFRDLSGKNVYISAKMGPIKDEFTGITTYQPSMPGSKLGPSLPYYFDEVFRFALGKDAEGNEFRYLQTQPDLQHVAKDRSGSLAPVEEPNLTKIFKKILGV